MGAYYGLGLGLGGAPVPIRGSHIAIGGLIEQYQGAAVAYSLRAIATTTWGYVVRVRRASDNSEQDFTALQVADGTLTTFCGVGDGFVETWYDQSGNGNDATQATIASQPKIVNSGALVTGGLDFDGTSSCMATQSIDLTGTDNLAIFSVLYERR